MYLYFSQSAFILPDIKSTVTKRAGYVLPTEKEKKATSSNRLSTIFKVKFKKDDFLSKKSQGKSAYYFIYVKISYMIQNYFN